MHQRSSICLWLALSMIAAPVTAAETIPDVPTPVAGYASITYLDLLRQVMPDIAVEQDFARGKLRFALRSIDGLVPETEMTTSVDVRSISAQPFTSGDKPHLALIVPLGEDWLTMLAVFEMGPAPRFVDAADIGLDRLTGFDDQPILPIGDGHDALVTSSAHANASESFEQNALIMLHAGSLQLVEHFTS